MGARKKKLLALAFDTWTPEMRHSVATWLRDRIGEMEPDADSIAEEEGVHMLPCLRGLAEHVDAPPDPKKT